MPRPSSDEPDQSNTKADSTTKAAEMVKVSDRDFKRVLELLEHPPKPNAKLRAAIAALPDTI